MCIRDSRSDGEPAIVALKRESAKICRESCGMEADLEETAIGDSDANGLAEVSVKECKAKIRTRKDAAEKLHGTTLHPSLPRMAAY
eukprot:10461374-Karenia_brevis.AAC.1